MLYCHKCKKIIGKDGKAMKTICGRCRDVLKYALVNEVLKHPPVYLSEENRNKDGRHKKLSDVQKLEAKRMHNQGKSYEKIAAYYRSLGIDVHKTTIFNAVRKP